VRNRGWGAGGSTVVSTCSGVVCLVLRNSAWLKHEAVDSPYTPGVGVSPPLLVGCDDARVRGAELFARTASFGSPGRSPLVLTGVRGLGKTVLLHAITQEAAGSGFLIAWRRWIGGGRWPGGSLRRSQGRWPAQTEHVSAVAAVGGQPGQGVGGAGGARVKITRPAQQERPGLCLAFDELQEGADADLAVVAAIAQELVAAPLVVSGAGLPQTPEKLMRAGSYAERFTFRKLQPLSGQQAAAALLVPANTLGWPGIATPASTCWARQTVPVSVAALRRRRLADGRPGVGRADRPAGRAGQRGRGDGGCVRRDVPRRWNRAQPVAAAVHGRDGPASGRRWLGRHRVGRRDVGRPVTSMSFLRTRLLDEGLIQPAGYGRVAFSMAGFEAFVRQ